jgi:hypothetical protein
MAISQQKRVVRYLEQQSGMLEGDQDQDQNEGPRSREAYEASEPEARGTQENAKESSPVAQVMMQRKRTQDTVVELKASKTEMTTDNDHSKKSPLVFIFDEQVLDNDEDLGATDSEQLLTDSEK